MESEKRPCAIEIPRKEGAAQQPQPIILQKQSSQKANCLCSPTTHSGSFRCRRHRNHPFRRSGTSVGSGLSDLAAADKTATSPSNDNLTKA